MNIKIAKPSDLSWINKYYEEISFKITSEKDLQIYITVDEKVAGLGRIVHVDENHGELGGIYVLPDFRGKKIAEEIVNSLLTKNNFSVLWCIPFKPLEVFYRKFGFRELRDDLIPEEIRLKFDWCEGRYPDPAILLVKKIN